MATAKDEKVKKLLNDLNIAASKEQLGEYIVALVEKVADLEARVETLEAAP